MKAPAPIMTFDYYSAQAMRTKKEHPNPEVRMLYFSGALCGEAGEQFELIKKHIRDGTPLDLEKLSKELGDVLWYVAAICDIHGLSLAEVAYKNLKKLEARYPAGHFDAADSPKNRD